MPAKRKTTKKAEAAPDVEEAPKEETRPVMTQVVEVVEEKGESHEETKGAGEEEDILTKAAEEEHTQESPQQEEKRKEVVSELYEEEEEKEEPPRIAPEISVHERKRKPLSVLLWIFIVIVVAVITGGGLYMVLGGGAAIPSVLSTPTPTPTPQPSPTPTPEPPNRVDVKVQVLNGGGVAGAAGKMKTLLEEKGYRVLNTGNTDEYSYDETQVLVKPEREAYLTLLREDIGESYVIGDASATLPEDDEYDVRVIVGKE